MEISANNFDAADSFYDSDDIFTDEYGVQYNRTQRILLKAPSNIVKYIVIKGTKIIGNAAFSNCKQLKQVVLPKSLIEIKHYAFAGCQSLFMCAIPNGVRKIGNGVFKNCTHLSGISFPRTVLNIENDIFSGCERLNVVYVPNGEKHRYSNLLFNTNAYTEEYDCDNKEKVQALFDILTSDIDKDGVLYDYDGLTLLFTTRRLESYSVRPGTFFIKTEAFNPRAWNYDRHSLKSVHLPESVCYIGGEAFAYNEDLEFINLPQNAILDWEANPFAGCKSLHAIKWETENTIKEGTLIYNADRTVLISCLNWQYVEDIKNSWSIMPFSRIYGTKVKQENLIDAETGRTYNAVIFTNTDGTNTPVGFSEELDGLTIRDLVKQKETIMIIQSLSGRFSFVRKFDDKIYPDRIVKIPDGVETITSKAFWENEYLEEIIFPESIKHIGDCAFWGCKSLKSICVPYNQAKRFKQMPPLFGKIIKEMPRAYYNAIDDELPF